MKPRLRESVKERVMRINENLFAFKSISSPGAKISFLRPSQERREVHPKSLRVIYRFLKAGCDFLTQQGLDVNELGGYFKGNCSDTNAVLKYRSFFIFALHLIGWPCPRKAQT
jgi:hypothetical protein